MALRRILTGLVLQDTYEVSDVIGRGGVGVVYKATHRRLNRDLAVKVLSPDLAREPETIERFQREAEITSKLGHPHIVEVVDFNTSPEGAPYIVMELLVGESLDERLERHGQLPLQEIATILEQTASALQAAHDEGVIHRDLKPQNIYLCKVKGGTDSFVKVLDFGMSKVRGVQKALTAANVILGTPWYMSPEQAIGRSSEADKRTDVFSVGSILYHAIAGQRPFEGDTIDATLYQVIHEQPQPLLKLRPELPDRAAEVVARAMSKRPEDRYDSILELSSAFAAALEEKQREPREELNTSPYLQQPIGEGPSYYRTESRIDALSLTEPPLEGPPAPPDLSTQPGVGGPEVVPGGGVSAAESFDQTVPSQPAITPIAPAGEPRPDASGTLPGVGKLDTALVKTTPSAEVDNSSLVRTTPSTGKLDTSLVSTTPWATGQIERPRGSGAKLALLLAFAGIAAAIVGAVVVGWLSKERPAETTGVRDAAARDGLVVVDSAVAARPADAAVAAAPARDASEPDAPAVRATAKRQLTIVTVPPGAAVSLNGRRLGKTPLRRMITTARASAAIAKQGFAPEKRTLRPGVKAVRLKLILKALAPTYGTLRVGANVLKARVYIDDKQVGSTPFRGKVLVGSRAVRVEKIGYDSYTTRVLVRKDEVKKVAAKLVKY